MHEVAAVWNARRAASSACESGERPALDYTLPPLAVVLPRAGGRPGRVTTQLYIWGYGPLRASLVQCPPIPTDTARAVAAAHGWEATRPGAWALEWSLPLPLSQALEKLTSALRGEASVSGWGGRMVRDPVAECPAPVRDCHPAVAAGWRQRQARALCEQARAVGAAAADSTARSRDLRRQIREQRLVRLQRLPPVEFAALNQTVTAAIALAKEGQLAAGYALLQTRWEQATVAAEQGVSWSFQRRWIYGLALENYLSRFGVPLP